MGEDGRPTVIAPWSRRHPLGYLAELTTTIVMRRADQPADGLLPIFERVFTWLWERGTPRAD